ncbi:GH39 family glycosyl hydrolase [Pseudonocardia sp. H11422]|uniref:GH39 family glycosyl hydrolase n=1 Tax=Pseudonocardia sp. H11422 TaxID=2835866 RepID=UPI00202886DB|nr:hypothetical protein [Pseudonocardia sp. H11422]
MTSAQQAVSRQVMLQNQHIMGWGVENPEPAPGMYDFSDLDSRMGFIRESGGIPIITLCCAPDWMKGGTAGETDWNELTTAPLPEHYADFADLSAVIARRYPDVRHFMVWNEFKGFFDEATKQWKAREYTDLYNQVYDAIKAVNPDNRVGGPYIGMATTSPDIATTASTLSGPWGSVDQRALETLDYWLANKRGADFVVVDGLATRAGGAGDEFAALGKLSAVSRWVRERTALPLWWAEWHVEPAESGWTDRRQIALRTAAMITMATSGVNTALYWNPSPASEGCAPCLWTDTRDEDGGRPLPLLSTLQEFARWFPPGTPLEEVPAPPEVRVLSQPRRVVAVNTVNSEVTVQLDGRAVRLGPYETRWITRERE